MKKARPIAKSYVMVAPIGVVFIFFNYMLSWKDLLSCLSVDSPFPSRTSKEYPSRVGELAHMVIFALVGA